MYDVLEAIEYVPKPFEMGTSQWVLLKAENGTIYQVKFNQEFLAHNTHEFIGNFIGSAINAPVPQGVFLQIPEYLLTKCSEELGYLIDMSLVVENIFFGIEWIYGQVKFEDTESLLEELPNTMNYEQYPSIFPFDQYLRNDDRHVDNHLIVKIGKKQHFYYSIDSDKIFGGYPLGNVLTEKDDFGCFANPAYQPLYDSIDDKLFKIILTYISAIERLSAEQLAKVDEYLADFYGIDESIRGSIQVFLKYRKDNIYEQCISNQHCYENLHQLSLMGV